MNLSSIHSLPVHRWVIGRCVLFALLGLLALDGGFSVTSAFEHAAAGFGISPPTLAYTATEGLPNEPGSIKERL
jgi:hypothetical protein